MSTATAKPNIDGITDAQPYRHGPGSEIWVARRLWQMIGLSGNFALGIPLKQAEFDVRTSLIPDLKSILPFAVSVLLLAYVLVLVDTEAMAVRAMTIPVWSIAVVLCLLFGNIVVVSIRLSRILAHLRAAVGAMTALRATVSGLVSSLFMFSLAGSILGRQVVLRDSGIRASVVALLTVYERLVLVFVGGGLFSAGALVLFGSDAVWSILTRFPMLPMAFALTASTWLGYRLSESRFEFNLIRKAFSHLVIRRVLEISGITIIGQGLSLATYVVVMSAIDPSLDMIDLFAAAAIISFAASFPLSVNGWGVRELAAVYIFGTLGVATADAVAVSVLIGLCSTLVVLATSPTLLLKRMQPKPAAPPSAAHPGIVTATRALPEDPVFRAISRGLPLVVSMLLFFQIGIEWNGSLITVNMADPLVIVGLLILGLTWITEKHRLVALPDSVKLWLLAVSAVLLIAFLLGASRFGVTPWAMNNRLFGWLILIGYLVCGAMIIGTWGQHGLRRLGEVIVATAACVVVTNMLMQTAEYAFGWIIQIDGNFQGFSGNRNAFAFQLIIALCFALVYAPVRKSGAARWLWIILTAIILQGLWQAQSRTGIVVTGFVIAAGLVLRVLDLRQVAWSVVAFIGIFVILRVVSEGFSILMENSGSLQALARVPEHYNPESLSQRLYSLSHGIEMWLEAPLFGAGLGAFTHYNLQNTGIPLVIHSVPVWILAEFGILGAAIVGSLPVFGLWQLANQFSLRHKPRIALLLLVSLAFAGFGLIHEIAYQRLFWLFIGATTALSLAGLRQQATRRAGALVSGETPIRVMHVITSLNRGGAETMLQGLVTRPDPLTSPYVVSLLSRGGLTQALRDAGIPVREMGFPNPLGLLHLAWLIRREQPDIVQGWMYHGDLAATLALYLSGRRSRTKLVWGIRCSDMDLSRYSRLLRTVVWCCARLSHLPDAVIANSEAGRRIHQAMGYHPSRFEVIRNGIDTERFAPATTLDDGPGRAASRAALGLPATARVVTLVARKDPMKDHTRLLDVIAAVPDLWLLLIGRGTETLMRQDRVIALGQRSDIPELLHTADAVVSSSAYGEGFSNALAEGMASGLVPIATDVGDSRFIADSVGWVIPPSDSAALKSALAAFAALPETVLRARKEAARQFALNNFTLAMAADRFREVYCMILGGV